MTSGYKSSGKYKSAAARQKVSSVTNTRYGLPDPVEVLRQSVTVGFICRREAKGNGNESRTCFLPGKAMYF